MTDYQVQSNEVGIFQAAIDNHLPLLIKGPTGCGKTKFVEHMAEKLKRPLYTIACHDDLSASDLVGRHLIGKDGTFWQDGPLTKAVREGGVCYIDEIVEARKDTTVVLHPLSDHRRILPLEKNGEIIEAHKDFVLVVSYNPGYQNLLKGLKPSTKQRFVTLEFDYPKEELEISIVCQQTAIDIKTASQLVGLAREIRNLKDSDINESVSTRLIIYTALMIKNGLSAQDACNHCLILPLTDEQETIEALKRLVNNYF